MNTIVLDTNILIDHVHGFAPWVAGCLNKPESFYLVLPTIVIAEYSSAYELETTSGMEKSYSYLSLFETQDLTVEIAKVLGKILRRKTYIAGASSADLIIASTALFLDARLATRNKNHFAKIPNLRFFDPSSINNFN